MTTTLHFTSFETTHPTEVIEADFYTTDLRARCIAPGDGAPALSTTPILTVRQEDSAARDIEIQVASDAAFTTVVWSTTLGSITPMTNHSVTIGVALTNGQIYWWRVRAVDTSGPTNGPWETRSFKVILPINAAGYETVLNNVGVLLTQGKDDTDYVLNNVGVELIYYKGDADYILAIVGVELNRSHDGYEYVLVGDVDTSTPTPHIWGLIPTSGHPGDGFIIVGFGFGDLQSTYSGDVQVDIYDGAGWVALSIVDWQTFPADPDMYGPDREINLLFGVIDPQHQEVQVQVPTAALPPGLIVRVRTNGP